MFTNIKAVGFDLDGTFLKTHVDYGKLNAVDIDVCGEYDIPFDELIFTTEKRLRQPIFDWLTANGRAGECRTISDEIDRRLNAIEMEFVDEAKPFPGSLECVRALRSKGYMVGLLTRGSEMYGNTALTKVGIRDEFDVVMGRDYSNYDDAKPSPKAMLSFAEQLNVEPSELLYIGDNRTDYHSARDSSTHFVGVLSGSMDRESWLEEDPDMLIIQYAGDILAYL